MSRWIICVCSLCLIAPTALADDPPGQTDQSQTDAAYARLQAKQAAATQPATISVADLDSLRAELRQLRAENIALKVEVGKLTAALAAKPKDAPAPAVGAAAAAPAAGPDVITISPREFASLPRDQVGQQAGFKEANMGAMGYIRVAIIDHIVDDKTAVVEIPIFSGSSGDYVKREIVIKGISTKGQTDAIDNPGWTLNCWLKITDTESVLGTTYLVAHPVVAAKK